MNYFNTLTLSILNIMYLVLALAYCYIRVSRWNRLLEVKQSDKCSIFCALTFGVLGAIVAIKLLPIIVYIVVFILTYALYHVNWKQCLFLTNDFVLVLILAGGISPTLLSILLSRPMFLPSQAVVTLEEVTALGIAIMINHFFTKKIINDNQWVRFLRNIDNYKEILYFQTPLFFCLVFVTLAYSFRLSMWYTLLQFFSYTCLTIAYRMLIDYVVRISVNSMYKMQYEIAESQLKLQMINYQNQVQQNQEIRKFKHDFASIMNTLAYLLENNKQ